MRRRQPPSALLYGFGLALLLSLAFNGYLLVASNRSQPGPLLSAQLQAAKLAMPNAGLQAQLQACTRSNHYKDSLLHVLSAQQTAATPPHTNQANALATQP